MHFTESRLNQKYPPARLNNHTLPLDKKIKIKPSFLKTGSDLEQHTLDFSVRFVLQRTRLKNVRGGSKYLDRCRLTKVVQGWPGLFRLEAKSATAIELSRFFPRLPHLCFGTAATILATFRFLRCKRNQVAVTARHVVVMWSLWFTYCLLPFDARNHAHTLMSMVALSSTIHLASQLYDTVFR